MNEILHFSAATAFAVTGERMSQKRLLLGRASLGFPEASSSAVGEPVVL